MWSRPMKPQDTKMLLYDVYAPCVFENALEANKNVLKNQKQTNKQTNNWKTVVIFNSWIARMRKSEL